MKQLLRTLGIFSLILFILGFLVTVYYTYFLMPSQLMEALELEGKEKLEIIKEAITPALVVIFVELILGFLVIISMASRQNNYDLKAMLEKMLQENQYQIQKQQQHNSQEQKQENNEERIKNFEAQLQTQDLNRANIFNLLCRQTQAVAAAFYVAQYEEQRRFLLLKESFAFQVPDRQNYSIDFGEGIAGQVAKAAQASVIKNVPADYLRVTSGLGEAKPTEMLIVPLLENQKVLFVFEMATFEAQQEKNLFFVEQILKKYKDYLC